MWQRGIAKTKYAFATPDGATSVRFRHQSWRVIIVISNIIVIVTINIKVATVIIAIIAIIMVIAIQHSYLIPMYHSIYFIAWQLIILEQSLHSGVRSREFSSQPFWAFSGHYYGFQSFILRKEKNVYSQCQLPILPFGTNNIEYIQSP